MRCKLDSLELNGRGAAQWFQITKPPPKMRFIKFVKVSCYTSSSNSLTKEYLPKLLVNTFWGQIFVFQVRDLKFYIIKK